jgi:hypothetical protein
MRLVKVLIAGIAIVSLCWAGDPVKGFQLKIVRDHGLPEALQIGDCIAGKLYIADMDHPLTGAGDVEIGATLELPWRANQKDISAIPAGSYPATIREDGDLGWRIELSQVPGHRENIEMHLGNWPKNSTGCILLGKSFSKTERCFVENSAQAISTLRKLYASPDHSKPIRVTISDH